MRIGSSNDARLVEAQYATADGLNTRISFHEKYSTNPQGFGNWLTSLYDIREGMAVLELGCGAGSIWAGKEELIARCGRLVLTDLSDGMLKAAAEAMGERENVEYRRADIQALPFPEASFDVVIANSMLYHVPDLAAGIAEVRRVLREDGTFYCATYGEHGFSECLADWFRLGGEEFRPNYNFTLENGARALRGSFGSVEMFSYEDSLCVTDTEDLIAYLRSLTTLGALGRFPEEKIREILNSHAEHGAIRIPKAYGTFIARGAAHT
ncbi:MAG: class I SAM-dependent methyltransferase [Ruminococcaceae bacterium]|nr:class I SAM-dependent methyltransferase [Oscillospiraceae bacterium]